MASISFKFSDDGKTWTTTIERRGKSWFQVWLWEPAGFLCTCDFDDDVPADLKEKFDNMPFDPGEVALSLQHSGEVDLFDDVNEGET